MPCKQMRLSWILWDFYFRKVNGTLPSKQKTARPSLGGLKIIPPEMPKASQMPDADAKMACFPPDAFTFIVEFCMKRAERDSISFCWREHSKLQPTPSVTMMFRTDTLHNPKACNHHPTASFLHPVCHLSMTGVFALSPEQKGLTTTSKRSFFCNGCFSRINQSQRSGSA